MKTVLVTGGNGQLAKCINDSSIEYSNLNFIWTDLPEFDIASKEQTTRFFQNNKMDYCINCAAYTAVDRAEIENSMAHEVNAIGPQNLALACKEYNVKLIHISTDFVFDGESSVPYSESDITKPISTYGDSKLKGEKAIMDIFDDFYIIRTSWLYSEYGSNFFKTMLDFSNTKNEINIIFDQVGTPTYAGDLAKVVLKMIADDSDQFGIYHFSNEGVASWYDFALAIFDECRCEIKVNPIRTSEYPTLAKRPPYSVLDKTKFKKTFQIEIPNWRHSLKKVIEKG